MEMLEFLRANQLRCGLDPSAQNIASSCRRCAHHFVSSWKPENFLVFARSMVILDPRMLQSWRVALIQVRCCICHNHSANGNWKRGSSSSSSIYLFCIPLFHRTSCNVVCCWACQKLKWNTQFSILVNCNWRKLVVSLICLATHVQLLLLVMADFPCSQVMVQRPWSPFQKVDVVNVVTLWWRPQTMN